MTASSVAAIVERPGVRQLVKFVIVGASSFAIDIGLFNLFFQVFHWPILYAKATSFLLAVANGFYWNRRWTFRATAGDAKKQYPKFVLTNTIGLILNLTIMTTAILVATKLGLIQTKRELTQILELLLSPNGRAEFPALTINLATIIATAFVTIWNFAAAKFFTFKQPAENR